MPRCDQCGLLAVRHKATRELFEVEPLVREAWNIIWEPNNDDGKAIFFGPPVCLAGAFSPEETRGLFADWTDSRMALQVIQRERECDQFIPWRQGLTPKEHLEMMTRAELQKQGEEQRRRDLEWQERQQEKINEWRRQMEAERRAWQESREARDAEIQLQREATLAAEAKDREMRAAAEAVEKEKREDRKKLILLVVGGLLTAFFGVVTAFLKPK